MMLSRPTHRYAFIGLLFLGANQVLTFEVQHREGIAGGEREKTGDPGVEPAPKLPQEADVERRITFREIQGKHYTPETGGDKWPHSGSRPQGNDGLQCRLGEPHRASGDFRRQTRGEQSGFEKKVWPEAPSGEKINAFTRTIQIDTGSPEIRALGEIDLEVV